MTIADLVFRNQIDNGLNLDDGGSFDTPATNITLRNLTVRDIVSAGNHDGIKLSGVNDFLIENVEVLNWGTGGSAVDMVGCPPWAGPEFAFPSHEHQQRRHDAAAQGRLQGHHLYRANRIDLPHSEPAGLSKRAALRAHSSFASSTAIRVTKQIKSSRKGT